MEQRPSCEAKRFSTSQEFPCIFWNSNVCNRVLNNPPPVPILSQTISVHTTIARLKNFNIILPSTSKFSKFPSGLPIKTLSPVHATCLYRFILFGFLSSLLNDTFQLHK